jgi:O-antigen ligase
MVVDARLGRVSLWKRLLVALGLLVLCLVVGIGVALLPLPGLAGLGTIVGFVGLCFRPDLTLPLALFTIPLDRLGHLTPDGSVTVAKVLILFAVLIWAARVLILRDRYPLKLIQHPVPLLMIAFFAFNILSLANARSLGYGFFFLWRRFSLVIFALLLAVALRNRRNWERVLAWMLWAGVPIALIGLYEAVTGDSVLSHVGYHGDSELQVIAGQWWRIRGTFENAPAHGIYMVTVTALALAWFLRSRSLGQRIALAVFLGALFANVLATGSRGGVLGLVIVLFVFWAGLGMRPKWAPAAALLVVGVTVGVIVLLLPHAPLFRYAELTGEDYTSEIRRGLYPVAFGMIADHPLLGVGAGNWLPNYPKYAAAPSPKSAALLPHNTYLEVWAENGLLGISAYLGMLGFAVYQFLTALRRAPTREDRLPLLACLGAVLAYAFYGGTANVVEDQTFWIFIAFSIVASLASTPRAGEPGDAP